MVKPIKTVVCDFDATLTLEDNYPFIKDLNMNAIGVLKEFQRLGGRVALNTAREGQQLVYALEALKAVGFVPDIANDNLPDRIKEYGHNCRKVMGCKFIDDRCIDFTGDWTLYRKILIDDNPYFKGRMAGYRGFNRVRK
jgi:hypothetical protein